MTAGADDPPLVRPRDAERPGIALDEAPDQLAGGSDFRVTVLRMRMPHAPAIEEHRMEHEPGDDLDDRSGIGGQGGEQPGELARVGRGALCRVESARGRRHRIGHEAAPPPSSQKRMSISRYIAVAVAACARASSSSPVPWASRPSPA